MFSGQSKILRIISATALSVFLVVLLFTTGFFVWTKNLMESAQSSNSEVVEEIDVALEPFPVGVNTLSKSINEDPLVDWYVTTYLSIDVDSSRKGRIIDKLLSQIAKWDWYQSMASAVSRILVIYPGERSEEVVKNFGDILKWTEEERELFKDYIVVAEPYLEEGKFFPGRYVVESGASPEVVADMLYAEFNQSVLSRYDTEVEKQVPLEQALIIASLLEREAYDFTDMRYISGIIWNRLFINMPLQLDASLQYAKGSRASEVKWWPKVIPDDKYIDSPFNTYQNDGLPPGPIANPSVEAIVAALNPRQTDCMFYFHDQKGKFYCNVDYAGHVAELREVYGQGR
jgi:cell division protein YceG involved in septum cleavage